MIEKFKNTESAQLWQLARSHTADPYNYKRQ